MSPHSFLIQGQTVPFAEIEIGHFCTALALSDLLEGLKIFDVGAKHIITRRDEVLDQISALKHCGFSTLLQMNDL